MLTITKRSLLPSVLITASLLGGCTGACTTDVRAAINIQVTHDSLADVNPGCIGQVILSDNNQTYVEYIHATSFSSGTNGAKGCYFSAGYERAGNYSLSIQLQGYEPIVLNEIDVGRNACHVETHRQTLSLTPAVNNCHDGYEWTNNQCQTTNACSFPTLEQASVGGLEGSGTSIECVNECMDVTGITINPTNPGLCESIALP